MPPRVAALLVDDDARLGALLKEYLGQNEVDLTVYGDGERALSALAGDAYQVVLLDVMLPGIDGLEVCRRIRRQPEYAALPILMLTAKGDDVDKIVGLELGADDYLAKPFNPRELLARVRALCRRSSLAQAPTAAPREHMRIGELEIHFGAREVAVSGTRQILTHFEFELLASLARARGRVLSREQLMDATSGRGAEFEIVRSLDRRAHLQAPLEDRGRSQEPALHQDGPRGRLHLGRGIR